MATDVHNHIIDEGHNVPENKQHEVHNVLEVLRAMAMIVHRVKHEGVHRARHDVRAIEGVHNVEGIDLEVIDRAINTNTVKMS